MVLAKGEEIDTLYLCTSNVYSNIALASTNLDTILWHCRLGHISEKGMQILHSRNLFPGWKYVDYDFCQNCVYGKKKRVNFIKVGKENTS